MKARGQGAMEYILLVGGVILVVILTLVILRGGILTSANEQISGSMGVFVNLTNASAAVESLVPTSTPTPTPTPTPPPNAAPSVSLLSPANGDAIPEGTEFAYLPSDDSGFSGATLWGNFTGSWAANSTNSTLLSNGSTNYLYSNLSAGYYIWNVLACDNAANCSFALANFSLRVVASGTNILNYTNNPSGGTDQALSIALDADGFVYVAGFDNAPGNNEWRVEKLYSSNLSLVWSYVSNPGGSEDRAQSIAFDGSGAVYVGGYDTAPGNKQWRVEKLNSVNGANIWNYTTNPSPGNDDGIAAVAYEFLGYIYAGGYDNSLGSQQWRVQKLYASNATVDWTYTNNPSADDEVYALAFDPAGWVFAVGNDDLGGFDTRLRVEQLYAGNGSRNWFFISNPSSNLDGPRAALFDSDGYVYSMGRQDSQNGGLGLLRVEKHYSVNGTGAWNYSSNPSAGDDLAYGSALNPAGFVYAAGVDVSLGNDRWRVEKLYSSNGSNAWNYTSNPSGGSDIARGAVFDSNSGFLYVTGFDNSPGNNEWRVERIAG